MFYNVDGSETQYAPSLKPWPDHKAFDMPNALTRTKTLASPRALARRKWAPLNQFDFAMLSSWFLWKRLSKLQSHIRMSSIGHV